MLQFANSIYFHIIQSHNLACRWGTTDYFEIISRHFAQSAAAFFELAKLGQFQPLMLSVQFFFCFPLRLAAFNVP